jgi:hypothetical protein
VKSYFKYLPRITLQILLAWRNIPEAWNDAKPTLSQFCWHLGQLLLMVVMPLLFWLSPIVTYFYSKELKTHDDYLKETRE